MIEAAIATATRMGIAREMTARSEFSTKGVYRSSKVFSRKVRAMREASMHMEVNPDFHKPMDDLVEEEEGQ